MKAISSFEHICAACAVCCCSPQGLLCGRPGQQSCCTTPSVCIGGTQCVNLGSSTTTNIFAPGQIATQQQLQAATPECSGDTVLVGGVCCAPGSACNGKQSVHVTQLLRSFPSIILRRTPFEGADSKQQAAAGVALGLAGLFTTSSLSCLCIMCRNSCSRCWIRNVLRRRCGHRNYHLLAAEMPQSTPSVQSPSNCVQSQLWRSVSVV